AVEAANAEVGKDPADDDVVADSEDADEDSDTSGSASV
ncbi:hypothetical protein A2U01_0099587, partial [Trifolium medium]|nr:hypothetical protein [Trifolium medium]